MSLGLMSGRVGSLREVERKLRRIEAATGRSADSILRQETRGLSVELARYTLPYGSRDGDRTKFQNAIAGDITRVFVSPSRIYVQLKRANERLAARFWAAHKRGRLADMRRILAEAGAPFSGFTVGRIDPAVHDRARTGSRGEVPDNHQGSGIATNENRLETYIRRKKRRVGRAASGWAAAGRALGGRPRGIARWKNVGAHRGVKGLSLIHI